jgi:hypothetical protein
MQKVRDFGAYRGVFVLHKVYLLSKTLFASSVREKYLKNMIETNTKFNASLFQCKDTLGDFQFNVPRHRSRSFGAFEFDAALFANNWF